MNPHITVVSLYLMIFLPWTSIIAHSLADTSGLMEGGRRFVR